MIALPQWLRALLAGTRAPETARRTHRCGPNIGQVYTLSADASPATPRPLYSRCEVCGERHYMGKYIGTLLQVRR